MDATISKLRRRLEVAEPFRAAARNGHTQTLLGHFLPHRAVPSNQIERVELNLPDGDRLVGFLARPHDEANTAGYLHIFHGLAGSTDSSYMSRTAAIARELGFNAVMWNHRGCGAGRKLAREPYHSGRSDDLSRAVKWGRDRELTQRGSMEGVHGVLGFSLSGNAAILLSAGVVPSVGPQPLSSDEFETRFGGALPDFAISICPPFDLKRASERLSSGPSRIYGQSFLPALLESLDDRIEVVELAARARNKLKFTDSVETFDACYTGFAGGFRDHLDYYERCSSGPYLKEARQALVVLAADDDPITHGSRDLAYLPKAREIAGEGPYVVTDFQPWGGHMGFVDRDVVATSLFRRPRWIDRRIRLYLEAFLDKTSR